jgi:hypothetical protein
MCEGRNDDAIKFFEKTQTKESGSLPKIIGGIYGNSLKINKDKENK